MRHICLNNKLVCLPAWWVEIDGHHTRRQGHTFVIATCGCAERTINPLVDLAARLSARMGDDDNEVNLGG